MKKIFACFRTIATGKSAGCDQRDMRKRDVVLVGMETRGRQRQPGRSHHQIRVRIKLLLWIFVLLLIMVLYYEEMCLQNVALPIAKFYVFCTGIRNVYEQ